MLKKIYLRLCGAKFKLRKEGINFSKMQHPRRGSLFELQCDQCCVPMAGVQMSEKIIKPFSVDRTISATNGRYISIRVSNDSHEINHWGSHSKGQFVGFDSTQVNLNRVKRLKVEVVVSVGNIEEKFSVGIDVAKDGKKSSDGLLTDVENRKYRVQLQFSSCTPLQPHRVTELPTDLNRCENSSKENSRNRTESLHPSRPI